MIFAVPIATVQVVYMVVQPYTQTYRALPNLHRSRRRTRRRRRRFHHLKYRLKGTLFNTEEKTRANLI
jgi:hypothetical protein